MQKKTTTPPAATGMAIGLTIEAKNLPYFAAARDNDLAATVATPTWYARVKATAPPVPSGGGSSGSSSEDLVLMIKGTVLTLKRVNDQNGWQQRGCRRCNRRHRPREGAQTRDWRDVGDQGGAAAERHGLGGLRSGGGRAR